MKKFAVSLLSVSVAGLVVAATQTIDGSGVTQSTWGVAPVAVQDTNTRFGNNFNELNLLLVDSDSDNLYLGIPGNIADNNALTIFISTSPDASTTLNTEPGGICPGNVPTLLRMYNNSTLDFPATHALTISVGIFPGQSSSQLVYAADLTDLNTLDNTPLGIGAVNSGNGLLTGATGAEIAINNSNVDGIGEWFDPNQVCADPNAPDTAITGYEIAIPRYLINLTGKGSTNVTLFAYISNNGQDTFDGVCFGRTAYGSNQGLPGLQCADNLASFSGVSLTLDFSAIAGTQAVTVSVPGP